MLDKLTRAFSLLRQDFNALKGDVQRLEKVRPIVKHGKDGVSPDPESIVSAVLEKIPKPRDGVSPDINDIAAEAAKLVPEPKPGRDAIAPAVRDVADVVLANIEKPKDGVSPDINVVAQEAAKLIPKPKDGVSPTPEAVAEKIPPPPPGTPGKDGKDGVSVTDVQLKNNDLFVFLDGVRKKAGRIEVPKQKLAFNPNGGGGRGHRPTPTPTQFIENRIVINNTGDWPDPVGGAIVLEPNKEYYIGDCDVGLPAKFNLIGPVVLSGADNVSCLTYLGSDPMFNGTDITFLVIQGVVLDLPNADLLNIEDVASPATAVVNLMDITVLRAGGIGTYKDILAITLSLIAFNSVGQGIRDAGTSTAIISAEKMVGISTNAAFKFFDFGNNEYSSLEFINIRTIAPAGAYAFSGLPSNGNIAENQIGSISSCEFIGGVAPLENITKDDFRYRFEGNGAAIPDTSPDALISMVGNVTPTLVTQNVPTKLLGTWALEGESHFESDTTGRITYRAEVPITVPIDIVIDTEPVSGTNKDIVIYVAFNGAEIISSGRRVRVDANNPRPIPAVWQQTFNKDDYIEVFVENETDGTSVLGSGGVSRVR